MKASAEEEKSKRKACFLALFLAPRPLLNFLNLIEFAWNDANSSPIIPRMRQAPQCALISYFRSRTRQFPASRIGCIITVKKLASGEIISRDMARQNHITSPGTTRSSREVVGDAKERKGKYRDLSSLRSGARLASSACNADE